MVCAALLLSWCCVTAGVDERWFPHGSPPAEVLEVVDLSTATIDTQLAAITLQGTVNGSDRAHVYVLTRPSDRIWLARLVDKGHIKSYTTVSVEDYFGKYANRCKKVIVYDPSLPDTINIATMMASLETAMVTAPEDVTRLAPGLPIEDLRGRWTSRAEAYRWAYATLRPRMSVKVLAIYHPTATHHFLRDYLVRCRVFHFWVTGAQGSDGRVVNPEEEVAFLKEVLAAEPVNIPVIGWWGGGADHGMTEYAGVGLAGEYGKITVGCDWAPNLSVLTAVPADVAGAARRYWALPRRAVPTLETDKVYIAYNVVESGDSPGYLQDLQPSVWDDPARGALPINWCMGAPVQDLLPTVAEYFFERATANDHLYMAISGAGYVHPYRSFMARTADPAHGWRDYLALTSRFMQCVGFRELGLYTDAWKPYDRARFDSITVRFAEGVAGVRTLVLGMGRDEHIDALNGSYVLGKTDVLVSHILTRWPVDFAERTREGNIAWLVDDIRAHTPTSRPAFMQVMALSWAYRPGEMAEVQKRLGPGYVPVTLPEFAALYRKAEAQRKAR